MPADSVARHVREAARALRVRRPDDEAVHAARKALKRARSGLRLLRPSIGDAAYRTENARLRDAGRRLSGVRDHRVLGELLGALIEEEPHAGRRSLLGALRAQLQRDLRQAWRALLEDGGLSGVDRALSESAQRIAAWRAPRDPASVAEAVERLHRKARKALKRSRSEPSDENLHEARKQAKHLAQALEIVGGGKPRRRAAKAMKRAQQVGDLLGDDHDLAVLAQRLAHLPGRPRARRKLLACLDARRADLQEKALRRARPLFRTRV
jgi:CHAD domain-containing protein